MPFDGTRHRIDVHYKRHGLWQAWITLVDESYVVRVFHGCSGGGPPPFPTFEAAAGYLRRVAPDVAPSQDGVWTSNVMA